MTDLPTQYAEILKQEAEKKQTLGKAMLSMRNALAIIEKVVKEHFSPVPSIPDYLPNIELAVTLEEVVEIRRKRENLEAALKSAGYGALVKDSK